MTQFFWRCPSRRVALLGVIWLGACSHNVYSPPSRGLPLDSAAALPRNRSSVIAAVSEASAIFGPDVHAGNLRASHGIGDGTELQVDATAARVEGQSAAGTDPWIRAGRVGLKINPGQTRNFAVTGGVGGGRHAGGDFVAADAGVVVAFENCYLVPTAAGQIFVSEPIDARVVDTTSAGSEERHIDIPRRTRGYTFAVGLRLPLGPRKCEDDARVSLHLGAGTLHVRTSAASEDFFQFAGGVEVEF